MQYFETGDPRFRIRFAVPQDVPVLLGFIKELAEYEKLSDQVTATEEILHNSLFERRCVEDLIAEYDGVPVGHAIFFYNFSTFMGKPGIYMEDLYIQPHMRGRGLGSKMLACIAKLALVRDCTRFEWICLDWNEPSLELYHNLGARPMEGWTVQRMEGRPLEELAAKFPYEVE